MSVQPICCDEEPGMEPLVHEDKTVENCVSLNDKKRGIKADLPVDSGHITEQSKACLFSEEKREQKGPEKGIRPRSSHIEKVFFPLHEDEKQLEEDICIDLKKNQPNIIEPNSKELPLDETTSSPIINGQTDIKCMQDVQGQKLMKNESKDNADRKLVANQKEIPYEGSEGDEMEKQNEMKEKADDTNVRNEKEKAGNSNVRKVEGKAADTNVCKEKKKVADSNVRKEEGKAADTNVRKEEGKAADSNVRNEEGKAADTNEHVPNEKGKAADTNVCNEEGKAADTNEHVPNEKGKAVDTNVCNEEGKAADTNEHVPNEKGKAADTNVCNEKGKTADTNVHVSNEKGKAADTNVCNEKGKTADTIVPNETGKAADTNVHVSNEKGKAADTNVCTEKDKAATTNKFTEKGKAADTNVRKGKEMAADSNVRNVKEKAADSNVCNKKKKAADTNVHKEKEKAANTNVRNEKKKAGDSNVCNDKGKAPDTNIRKEKGKAATTNVCTKKGKAADTNVRTKKGKAADTNVCNKKEKATNTNIRKEKVKAADTNVCNKIEKDTDTNVHNENGNYGKEKVEHQNAGLFMKSFILILLIRDVSGPSAKKEPDGGNLFFIDFQNGSVVVEVFPKDNNDISDVAVNNVSVASCAFRHEAEIRHPKFNEFYRIVLTQWGSCLFIIYSCNGTQLDVNISSTKGFEKATVDGKAYPHLNNSVNFNFILREKEDFKQEEGGHDLEDEKNSSIGAWLGGLLLGIMIGIVIGIVIFCFILKKDWCHLQRRLLNITEAAHAPKDGVKLAEQLDLMIHDDENQVANGTSLENGGPHAHNTGETGRWGSFVESCPNCFK
ncbi:uncharacterized protein MAL8P1.12-like [Mya arenaria]|uniref:uncharacterized protein MAL8P1.12-like n=1 Tax=Mya arenaria TaxID=6604 RepID=UPI0022E3A2D7|nr:uncharacterized protein MAL8P1.12-like [Mya arenaria]